MRENRKHITRVSSEEARHLKDETDYARLDAMTDDDIAQAVADDPDAPPLDLDWTQARLTLPPGKDVVTLRLDRDVLDWFRTQGKGYQTRINQALRAFYEAKTNRKNLEALAESAKVAGAGAQSLAERELLQAGLREATLAKQTEFVKKFLDIAVQDATSEAVKIIQERMKASLEEIRGTVSRQSARPRKS